MLGILLYLDSLKNKDVLSVNHEQVYGAGNILDTKDKQNEHTVSNKEKEVESDPTVSKEESKEDNQMKVKSSPPKEKSSVFNKVDKGLF